VSGAVLPTRPRERAHRPGSQRPLFDDLRRVPAPPVAPLDTRAQARASAGDAGERRPRSGGGRLMLEAHLERIWEGLLVVGAAECAICGGALEWTGERGSCADCGSVLS
jgi:hypothetical protein